MSDPCLSAAKSNEFQHVRDVNLWEFHEACRERHLDKSKGVVGRSLSSCGTCFCEDVTELDEDDYPLVHIARKSELTSCLAIYLESLESDAEHVIEFFLPEYIANETGLIRLLETVKQQIKSSSRMQLDIISPPQAPPPESENIENELSNSAAAGTSQSVVHYSESKIEDFNIDPGKTGRKRKRSDRMISYDEIRKHFGKTMDEAASILKVSRSTLKRICRNLGIPRWPYKNGPDKSDADTFVKSDQTVGVFTSEGAPTSIFGASNEQFGGTTYTTRDPNILTENGKHGSTHVPHQKEQANPPDEFVQPETSISGSFFETDRDVTIKATYREDTIKFAYCLLDGLVKLEELVATRFQLRIGSFRLKYKDEDGDMILIACENDFLRSGGFRQPDSNTVIKLSVHLVADQSSDA
ncbi:putative transcription factor Nin-like family [Helianthus anomalus]